MAVDSRGSKGEPIFLNTGAPATADDLTLLGEEIYERGTRLVLDQAGMDQLVSDGFAFDGIKVFNTTDNIEYVRVGGAWDDGSRPWVNFRTLVGASGSWTAGSPDVSIQVRAGRAWLRGSMNNGGSFSSFTAFPTKLPAEYRPDSFRVFSVTTIHSPTTAYKILRISSDGTVEVFATAASSSWYFDGISWDLT